MILLVYHNKYNNIKEADDVSRHVYTDDEITAVYNMYTQGKSYGTISRETGYPYTSIRKLVQRRQQQIYGDNNTYNAPAAVPDNKGSLIDALDDTISAAVSILRQRMIVAAEQQDAIIAAVNAIYNSNAPPDVKRSSVKQLQELAVPALRDVVAVLRESYDRRNDMINTDSNNNGNITVNLPPEALRYAE